MENDLKTLTFELTINICKALSGFESGVTKVLADELALSSYRTSFAASSARSALNRDRFIRHLEEGYYASGRTFELLRILKAMEAQIEGIDSFIEEIDKIHRMFGASIKTIQRKNNEARV